MSIASGSRRRGWNALTVVLAAVMALFLGILVFVWIKAKHAHPVQLDEHGRPVSANIAPANQSHAG